MQTINLNQNSFRLFPTIYMVQNDTGRELKMILDDVTLAGTETGAVAIKRSDGSYYTISATIDATNNAFDADMTQALTQPSRTECQLKVTASDDTVISTYTFIIEVQPSTDGVSEEQLGINPQDLIDAAAQLTLGDNDVKLALLQIAEKVVYTDPNGQQYYDALEDALYPPIRATSVTLNKNSLVFSGIGGTDTLVATVSPNNVEDDTVYWGSSDKDVAVVSDGIVTAVGIGSCTITATCGTKHASAPVSVAAATLLSISVAYTQSGTVYDDDSLDSLKSDLVVTAYWDNSTTSVVPSTDYTLSGTITVGTSTITAEYGGKTDTFNVTVTSSWSYEWNPAIGTLDQAGFTVTNAGNHLNYGDDGVTITGVNSTSTCPFIANPVDNTNSAQTIEYVINFTTLKSDSNSGFGMNVQYNGTKYVQYRSGVNTSGNCSYSTGTWTTISTVNLTTGTDYTVRISYNTTQQFVVTINGDVILSVSNGSKTSSTANRFLCLSGTYTLKALRVKVEQ